MELSIKGLKTMDGPDGMIFRCTVLVGGKPAFVASNDGNGGCNAYDPVRGRTWDAIREAEAWAKVLPPRTVDLGGEPFTLQSDLDLVVEDLINDELDRRWLKRQCRTKTLFRLPGAKDGEWMVVKAAYDERVRDWVRENYPGATIANEGI